MEEKDMIVIGKSMHNAQMNAGITTLKECLKELDVWRKRQNEDKDARILEKVWLKRIIELEGFKR